MLVSVLMPVYNSERFLAEAIQSTLGQTFEEFELIVIDDGSTDGSREIVERFAAVDRRVALRCQEHKGVVAARNLGLSGARSDLVALMDADDRMHSTRLATQAAFLQEHPSVAVCCTWANLIDARGSRIGRSGHSVDVDKGVKTLKPSCFLNIINPSVMYRKQVVLSVGAYRRIGPVEDRDLFARLVARGCHIYCIREYLLDYRLHCGAITGRNQDGWKVHFIDGNCVRVLRGEEPLTVEAYWKRRTALPLFKKVGLWRDETSKLRYKRAVRQFGEGRVLSCVGNIAYASGLQPCRVFASVFKALRPP
jgi:glycosyltransferase involved in cell wall biosynthesis